MKKTLLLFFFGLSSACLAQKNGKVILPIDSVSNLVTYQGVVKVEGASKDDLYLRAREWFAKTFKSAQAVLQMDDKQAGKLIGKGASKSYYTYMLYPVEYNLNYTISITTKDGRYRYEISSFRVNSESGMNRLIEGPYDVYNKNKGTGLVMFKKIIPFVESTSIDLVSGIADAMKQPSKDVKSKDDF